MTDVRPDNWRGSDLRTRSEVVNYLKQRGGEVLSPQGLAAGAMRDDLGKGRALGQLLGEMERDGMIEREVRGRRTFRIKLIDDWNLGDDTVVDVTGTQPRVESADIATIPADVDLDLLADTLLAIVLKRATAEPDSGLVERLRTSLREAKELEQELRAELQLERTKCEEAHEQVRILTHNMEQLKLELSKPRRGGSGVSIEERLSSTERKMLGNLMKQLPGGKG